eukprot:3808985-Rhodomonas_salina.2
MPGSCAKCLRLWCCPPILGQPPRPADQAGRALAARGPSSRCWVCHLALTSGALTSWLPKSPTLKAIKLLELMQHIEVGCCTSS